MKSEHTKYWVILIGFVFILMNISLIKKSNFKEDQLKYPRVQESYAQKEADLIKILSEKKIVMGKLNIFIRIFKEEDVLEIWGKNIQDAKFTLLKTFPVCCKSGKPGPKRKQGDCQVPEGFYHINAFNPNSNYYLSMMINYPNASDKILGVKGNLGNLICIHGNCVSVGCIPITDDCIKEVYLLATEARNNGQDNIPVHIFPFRFTEEKMKEASILFDNQMIHFWKNLETIYHSFEKTLTTPKISVNKKGEYVLLPAS